MSEIAQGFEQYSPSRLEWLIVMLNSYVHYINSAPGDRIDYLYTLGSDGNTIVMNMRHYADMPPETVENLADIGIDFAMQIAKRYKWDSWIKIETEFDPKDRPAKEQN